MFEISNDPIKQEIIAFDSFTPDIYSPNGESVLIDKPSGFDYSSIIMNTVRLAGGRAQVVEANSGFNRKKIDEIVESSDFLVIDKLEHIKYNLVSDLIAGLKSKNSNILALTGFKRKDIPFYYNLFDKVYTLEDRDLFSQDIDSDYIFRQIK